MDIVFDIQRFSTHDGPGIRTTVFLKGCPLRCFWCHNPESLNPHPQILFTESKCMGCGRCVKSCLHGAVISNGEIDREKCTGCGICADACPPRALSFSGKNMTAQEILMEAEKDRAFYEKSGGGITLSGGEALLQSKFAAEVLSACKSAGIHTALDTCGEVPFSAFEEVLPYTDIFLYDIKAAEPERHKKGCGTDGKRIAENLKRLSALGADIRLRVPVIPGFNDSKAAMGEICALIDSLPSKHPLDLLRFHRMGGIKYKALGMQYKALDYEPPDDGKMEEFADMFRPFCESVTIA